MARLFGTDGIRGVANVDLKPTTAYALGRAVAHRLAGRGGAIVVGQTLPPQLAAVNRAFLNVSELVVRAALDGNRANVYHAAMLDPSTAATLTLDAIVVLCDEMIAAHGAALPEGVRDR